MLKKFGLKASDASKFDAKVIASFLSIMDEETHTINDTHEIGVESADLHFDTKKATAGGSRTEAFLKEYKLTEEQLFELIGICANEEFIQIYEKNEVPQILDGKDHSQKEHIHFFAVQDAGKEFIASNK